MDYLKWIDEDIRRYGKNGDKTLEYIGMNIIGSKCVEYKCYRFTQLVEEEAIIIHNLFEDCGVLRRLDFTEDYKEQLYRVAYKIDLSGCCEENKQEMLRKYIGYIISNTKCTGVSVENVMKINKYIKCVLKTDMEPLCVMGGKIDTCGVIQELKLYFQLNVFRENEKKFYLAEQKQYYQIIDFLSSICNIQQEDVIRMKKEFKISQNNCFKSMMLGIDFDKKVKKIKYYFQRAQEEKMNKSEIGKSHNKERYFKNMDECEKIIKKVLKKGVRLKGYAIPYYCDKQKSIVNFYFYEE